LWCKSSLDEVKPEYDLTELQISRVSQADDDDADTVCVTNEQVVRDMVWLVARELPHAYLTNA